MRNAPLFALPFLAAFGCAPPAPPSDPIATSEAAPGAAPKPAAISDGDLEGRWRIVSIDGRPPLTLGDGGNEERSPQIVFTRHGYGGNSGCNGFGGMGVLHGDRFYGGGAMQTLIGCGPDLEGQERDILSLLGSAPRIRLGEGETLALIAGDRDMVLRRIGPLATAAEQQPWEGTRTLAGTNWIISGVDGPPLRGGANRTLIFEAERWSLSGPCGTIVGNWRQQGDHILAGPAAPSAAPSPACAPHDAAADAAIMTMLAAEPRFATGPNGEILIGGGDHWVTGEQPRRVLADDAPLLAGRWRIVAIDGAPPMEGTEPRIAFGPTGYDGSAGCNSFQAHYLAHGRRFYSPPPMQTQMACGPRMEQERKVTQLLARGPRIALGSAGEAWLVHEQGSLRLRREAAAGSTPGGTLWAGAPLQAELTMIDGHPLRDHYSQPEVKLRLSAQRFDMDAGCGHFGGVWRVRQGDLHFFADAEREPQGACAGGLAKRIFEFNRLFNGRGRILIGTSGELIIAGERNWLIGRRTGSRH